ncbi:hypothetical protein CVT24_008112 [Panaeolus cyanescens]|uniref:Uncharacterized protein n=1 Tax=Panaeolus cyanescens TaxID=181874 RepID=A0A409YLM1_9AGAR|nr:hypothetical protein CVT24_008112 [Panaeolus cyanescens]
MSQLPSSSFSFSYPSTTSSSSSFIPTTSASTTLTSFLPTTTSSNHPTSTSIHPHLNSNTNTLPRLPHPQYISRNGFKEHLSYAQTVSKSSGGVKKKSTKGRRRERLFLASEDEGEGGDGNGNGNEDEGDEGEGGGEGENEGGDGVEGGGEGEDGEKDDGVDYQRWYDWRWAQFAMQYRKQSIPDLESMKSELDAPHKAEPLSARLKTLEDEHIAELEVLYDIQAKEYEQELEDVRWARDEDYWASKGDGKPKGWSDITLADSNYTNAENKKHLNAIDAFLNDPNRLTHLTQTWTSTHSLVRYSYLTRLNNLYDDDRKRMRQFPVDIDDFRARTKEWQLRVARFLVSEGGRRERLRVEFGWGVGVEKGLVDRFEMDESFSAEVRAMVVAADHIRDPRQRPGV